MTLDEIQDLLEGDDYLDTSGHLGDDTALVDNRNIQNNSDKHIPNDSVKFCYFTIVKSADLDEDLDCDPCEESNSDNDDDDDDDGNVG